MPIPAIDGIELEGYLVLTSWKVRNGLLNMITLRELVVAAQHPLLVPRQAGFGHVAGPRLPLYTIIV